jgi:hypothetical protein
MTSTSDKDIWDKLCARFGHSSTQRLNMLSKSFFQAQQDCKEDITTQAAKLQQLSVDLNSELAKHSKNKLSECTLTGRILSTFGNEYFNFKNVWDTIPTSKQMVNLLIQKLCVFELPADKLASAEATAFTAHENNKKKLNYVKLNSSKSKKKKKKLITQKRNFLATSANNLVTGLWSTLKSSSMQGTVVVNQPQRRMPVHS